VVVVVAVVLGEGGKGGGCHLEGEAGASCSVWCRHRSGWLNENYLTLT
jgi:hypothetical protein